MKPPKEEAWVAFAETICLLHFHFGSRVLEFLGELVGLFLRNARLHRLAALVHQVLGLLEAEARGRADHLDDVDLVRAGRLEDDVERRLLLLDRRRRSRRGRHHHAAARRRLHAELLLERLHRARDPQDVLLGHELGEELRPLLVRELADLVHQTCNVRHVALLLYQLALSSISAPASLNFFASASASSFGSPFFTSPPLSARPFAPIRSKPRTSRMTLM